MSSTERFVELNVIIAGSGVPGQQNKTAMRVTPDLFPVECSAKSLIVSSLAHARPIREKGSGPIPIANWFLVSITFLDRCTWYAK